MQLLLTREYVGDYLRANKIQTLHHLQEHMRKSILRSNQIDLDEIFCLYALTRLPAEFKLNSPKDAVREMR